MCFSWPLLTPCMSPDCLSKLQHLEHLISKPVGVHRRQRDGEVGLVGRVEEFLGGPRKKRLRQWAYFPMKKAELSSSKSIFLLALPLPQEEDACPFRNNNEREERKAFVCNVFLNLIY